MLKIMIIFIIFFVIRSILYLTWVFNGARMSKDNIELIQKVADAFSQQLNKEYFSDDRPQKVIEKSKGDESCLNRLFDAVELPPDLTDQLYKKVSDAKDPVHEWLEPLVLAISDQVLNATKMGLNETIAIHFIAKDEISRKFKTQEDYRDTLIRAIASGCAAIFAGKGDNELNQPSTNLSPEELQKKAKHNNNISMQFDKYCREVSGAKLYPTFLGNIYRAFLFVVKFFLQSNDTESNDTIECRVTKLYDTVHEGITKLGAYSKSSQYLPLLTELENLKKELETILDEIELKKQDNQIYEDSATASFKSHGTKFITKINELLTKVENEEEEKLNGMSALTQLCYTLFNRNTMMDTMKCLTGADPELLRSYQNKEYQPVPKESDEDDTQASIGSVRYKF